MILITGMGDISAVLLLILAPLALTTFRKYSFYRAVHPDRESIQGAFSIFATTKALSVIQCAGGLSSKVDEAELWRIGFKFDLENKNCSMGSLPRRAVEILREYYQPIALDDPEVIYLCYSCPVPDQTKIITFPSSDTNESPFDVADISNGIVTNCGTIQPGIFGASFIIFRYFDAFLICGSDVYLGKACKHFDLLTKTLTDYPETLNEARGAITNVVEIDYNEYWIPGGFNLGAFTSFQSTEYFRNGVFQPGPDLPMPNSLACIIRVDMDNVLILGGNLDPNTIYNDVYAYNLRAETFEPRNPLKEARFGSACGKVEDADGNVRFIVAGGYYGPDAGLSSIEIMDENTNWNIFFYMDKPITRPSFVQLNGYFLTLGGYEPGIEHLTRVMNCTINGCNKVADNVISVKSGQISFLVEDKFFTCP